MPELTLVGWREKIALPDIGLHGIEAKIDTGARTSALHALNIERFERDGQHWVRFKIDLGRGFETAICETPGVAARTITSSNGHAEDRLIVKMQMQMGDKLFRAEFSLTDRSDMTFPVLVGRTALRSRFIVDPARSYLVSPNPGRERTQS